MWNPIETAPTDGTVIIVVTKGGHLVKALWTEQEDYAAWGAADEGKHPPCWSAGVCWASNEDEEPSDPPVLWAPAPVSLTP